ncbi:MAG TPA: hypothetical protein PLE96_01165 [bacterium]|nr:hypothetical protein [bacterium]
MNQKLEEKIKEQIKNEKPRSRWYFLTQDLSRDILLFILWIFLVIAVGFFTNILIDFQLNRLKVPGPGQFFTSFSFFPVELLIIITFLIVLIYYLFRNIGFLYRLSSWIIIVLIFCSVFLGYFVSEAIGANKTLINSTIGQQIYNRQGRLLIPGREDVVVGIIKSVSDDVAEVEDYSGKIWQVLIANETDRREFDSFAVGERIWVLGEKAGDKIKAQAVRSMRNQPRNGSMRGKRILQSPSYYQIYGNHLN